MTHPIRPPGRRLHVLHIGKTGGSALKAALRPVAEAARLVLHRHETRLRDVPAEDLVVFVAREPVARFVSAFNSRLRRGRPRLNSAWNDAEATAFGRFGTPNALAEALSSPDAARRAEAEEAMRGIRHVNAPLSNWLEDASYVASRRASIALIGFQESLEAGFARLSAWMRLPASVALPSDPVVAHRTPEGFDTALDRQGRTNLARWYARDIELHRFLQVFARDLPPWVPAGAPAGAQGSPGTP